MRDDSHFIGEVSTFHLSRYDLDPLYRGNSVRNEIANNKGDFRDGVCLKPLNGFE